MTIDTVRRICLAFPGVTEDVKWGNDLVFSVSKKMFAALDINPPHSLGFKCSPETFSELIEREGIIPAPYLARAMWVKEEVLGASLDRRELETALRAAYDIVVARLPASRQPGKAPRSKPNVAARSRSDKPRRPTTSRR